MAALMGMPGTDMELVQVALHSLKMLALPTKVPVGKSMFGEYADVQLTGEPNDALRDVVLVS